MKAVKKVIATALLATMVAGTAVAATTVDNLGDLNGVTMGVESEMQIPTISVTVPTSAKFIINPFGKNIEEDTDANISASNKQIVSADITIENGSEVDMDVILDGFTTTIGFKDKDTMSEAEQKAADKIVLATAPISPSTTSVKKDVFLFLGVKGEAFDSKNNAKQVVKASATGLNHKLGTMDKEDGSMTLAFDGSVNKNATWNDEDGLSVTPTFKFIPKGITE